MSGLFALLVLLALCLFFSAVGLVAQGCDFEVLVLSGPLAGIGRLFLGSIRPAMGARAGSRTDGGGSTRTAATYFGVGSIRLRAGPGAEKKTEESPAGAGLSIEHRVGYCDSGVYHIGEVYARSWCDEGTSSGRSTPKNAASYVVHRGVGISSTRT